MFFKQQLVSLTKLFLIAAILLFNSTVFAQEEDSKTKFMDKIGHWFVAYGMSSPEFIEKERLDFKSKAFAEVYIEGLIAHDAWMFGLLNKITKFRYEAKQNPHILIEVSFKPVTDELNDYNVLFKITSSKSVSIDLDKIASDVVSESLSGTYAEPQEAIDDVQLAIKKALTTLAEKLGDQLAPNLMVKYDSEIFWDGHDIHILDDATNTIELEAIGKDGNPLNAADISWTNATPIASSAKATVDITDVTNKEVSLSKGSDNLTVNVTRLGVDPDINELLKQLLIELLTVEKTEAQDTIVVLKQDSIQNLTDLRAQLALLEQYNFPLENANGITSYVSELRTLEDSSQFLAVSHKVEGFKLLRKRRRLTDNIKRKVNVAAFADLIVDEPERIKDLLDELVRNSGRLIARLILGTDSDGQRDAARDIVVDFLNRNIDRIANANTEDSFVEAPLPVIVIEDRSKQPTFNTSQRLYISDNVQIEGRNEFITTMTDYLNQLPTPTVMVINYSQDVGTGSYQNRTTGARPVGLPAEYDFITVSVVNIPGSVREVMLLGGDSPIVGQASDAGIKDPKGFMGLIGDDATLACWSETPSGIGKEGEEKQVWGTTGRQEPCLVYWYYFSGYVNEYFYYNPDGSADTKAGWYREYQYVDLVEPVIEAMGILSGDVEILPSNEAILISSSEGIVSAFDLNRELSEDFSNLILAKHYANTVKAASNQHSGRGNIESVYPIYEILGFFTGQQLLKGLTKFGSAIRQLKNVKHLFKYQNGDDILKVVDLRGEQIGEIIVHGEITPIKFLDEGEEILETTGGNVLLKKGEQIGWKKIAKTGGSRFFKNIDDFKTAIAKGDNVFYVGKHADITPRPTGVQSHHGVNSVWMKAKYSNYTANKAPSVYMLNNPNHNATRGVFNTWAKEMRTSQGLTKVDYTRVTKDDILDLAKKQFDAADAPQLVRDEYYKLWDDYLKTLTPK